MHKSCQQLTKFIPLVARVRAAIRAGDEQYTVTAFSRPRFCSADYNYDLENCEEGLWKNALVVKVTSSTILQTFHSNAHADI